MNQSFDLNRWWLLVSKHWSENRKKYSLSLVAMAGLLLIWFVFTIIVEPYRSLDGGIQVATYYFGLSVVGCLYASLLFADLASKSKGINYLSVPASHLEKLACSLFYAVLVFFVCYTAVFYLIDIAMVKLSNSIAYHHWLKDHTAGAVFNKGKAINVFVMPDRPAGAPNVFFYFLLGYFAVQAAFILGSVYFPKFSFIKTVIALLLISLFFAFFVGKVLHSIIPDGNFYRDLTSYNFYSNDNDYAAGKIVQLPEWVNHLLEFIVKYAFAPVFWLVTYFRLKEKEI